MLNQRHIIPCFPDLKVCRHMGTTLSLWAVRRRSPSCHSCYRSVFRPAFTDGSYPAWHVRQRISKLKTPTPIREPSLIRPADSAAPVSWAAYCRSFFNSSGATTECLRFSGFSALAFIRQALQAASYTPLAASGQNPRHGTHRGEVCRGCLVLCALDFGIGRSALFERECRFWRPEFYLKLRPYI